MENLSTKAGFLKNEYIGILSTLDVDAPRKWGKMNVQQMIEHMSDSMRIANGKTLQPTITPQDLVPRYQAFLMSEKPFNENTPNALLPDNPPHVKHTSIQDAIIELQQEIDTFFEVHEADAQRKTPNPFFGLLDYNMQVQLLHKHATHHLRQFGVAV